MISSTHVTILTGYANRGSVFEVLNICGHPSAHTVRQWTVQLLEALDYLHLNGISHKAIHCNNVLIDCAPGGTPTPKLADCSYEYRLRQIHGTMGQEQFLWPAPEVGEYGTAKSRKTDVWELGVVFMQMLLGLGVVKQ